MAELEFELSAPHTLESIAKKLGISFQQVSKIEKRALKKLKAMMLESELLP